MHTRCFCAGIHLNRRCFLSCSIRCFEAPARAQLSFISRIMKRLFADNGNPEKPFSNCPFTLYDRQSRIDNWIVHFRVYSFAWQTFVRRQRFRGKPRCKIHRFEFIIFPEMIDCTNRRSRADFSPSRVRRLRAHAQTDLQFYRAYSPS